ncbi:MAG: S8 family serine peptidase [Actinomycetota bacterium]
MTTSNQPTFGRPAHTKTKGDHIPGQMIVRVHRGALEPVLGAARLRFDRTEANLLPESVAEPLDYLRRSAGLKSIVPVFSSQHQRLARSDLKGVARQRVAVLSSVSDSESEELAGITLATLPAKEVTPGLMKKVEAAPAIEYVELVPARWLLAAGSVDPLCNLQWGLRAIRWFQAKRTNADAVRVAVLDTGIDAAHPDLKKIDIDYDHTGLSARDLIGHGTHVSGIIAALTNNSVGISGVAKTTLAVWKIFPDEPDGGDFFVDTVRYLRALNAVIGAGAKVLNLSIGGTASSQTEELLFRRLERNGVTVVAAMGNEYEEGDPTEYPGAYDGVLAVGSVAETLARSAFSNTGNHIGLVAPGSNILSTLPTRGSPYLDETDYASWSGTSMATPHVAGAAALVAAQEPTWTAADIKKHLRKTARRLPRMRGTSWTKTYGSGLLDLEKALS